MALGSCYTCIRYLMFAFNFLFWLLGCAVLGVGIWIRVDQNVEKYVSGSFSVLYTVSYILIAVGLLMMVVGFLGCCGAIRENQCLLGLFFGCLFIIFAILLGAGIFAVVAKDMVKQAVEDTLTLNVKNYDNDPDAKNFMNSIQQSLKCCGATTGITDYSSTEPASIAARESCLDNTETACAPALYDFISENLLIVAGIAIGIAVILIMGMIFSMVLCCAIRDTQG